MSDESSSELGLPPKLKEKLEAKIKNADLDIPVLPDIAARILSTPLNEDTDLGKLADLVQHDQFLAANVLRLTNSPLFAASREVTSLRQAVIRLGMATLREIVFSVAIKSKLFCAPGYDHISRSMWRFSAGSAAWAKEIARTCRLNSEMAFLCGLLHDFGRPVVLLAIIDLERALRQELSQAVVLYALEVYQARVGTILAARWNLPPQVAAAIEYFDRPNEAPRFSIDVKVAALADFLSHLSLLAEKKEDFEAEESARETVEDNGELLEPPPEFLSHRLLDDLDISEAEARRIWAQKKSVELFVDAF